MVIISAPVVVVAAELEVLNSFAQVVGSDDHHIKEAFGIFARGGQGIDLAARLAPGTSSVDKSLWIWDLCKELAFGTQRAGA
jgi:hypothetical protein